MAARFRKLDLPFAVRFLNIATGSAATRGDPVYGTHSMMSWRSEVVNFRR